MEPHQNRPRESYDTVAEEYAARIYGELADKPLDRQILRAFCRDVNGRGTALDMGCGPGQIARFLRDEGLEDVRGVDLSPRMVEVARRLNPDIPFETGDMRALNIEDGACAGIAAFYSIIHLEPEELPRALQEFHRVLAPGGLLLAAFHLGDGANHLDEWWGHPVELRGYYRPREVMEDCLRAAGFTLEASLERPPIPEVEYPSRRCYLFARP